MKLLIFEMEEWNETTAVFYVNDSCLFSSCFYLNWIKKQNTYFEEGRKTKTYFKRNFNFCSFHGQFKVILNNKPNLEVK